MKLGDFGLNLDLNALGQDLHSFVAELYPICRSITGDGLRETLRRIQAQIPLTIHEVPSGTQAFDWTVPKEWNVFDAYVRNSAGEKVIDFHKSNLHVVNYSAPVHTTLSLDELRPRLFSVPEHPDWIPYRTSYYKEDWGFCLAERDLQQLEQGVYEVCIESSLSDGHLSYGECYLEGESADEILISCHTCHPSLCNDNLSGVAVATQLARQMTNASRALSMRFLFIPGTIGSIVWLSRNEDRLSRIKHGLVLTCIGDGGASTYKKSRRGDAVIDRAMLHVLEHSGQAFAVRDFSPYGYDERQYCSPGFDLPVGCLMRTPHGQFPQYHTSADGLDLVRPEGLADSFAKCLMTIQVLHHDRRYLNRNPKCEPQLGRRGIYRAIGGEPDLRAVEMALLWVLNFSDGSHSLLDIAERSGMDFIVIQRAANLLIRHQLLGPAPN